MDAFVGLDLSLQSTGVAVITADKTAQYFSFGQKLKSKCGNYETIKRYISLTQEIVECLRPFKIQTIAIENYGFAGPKLAVQCEFGGVVKSQIFLSLRQVPVVLPSGTIRKLLLGHAKHKDIKQNVHDALLGMGYPAFENFDQSDALAVAHVVRLLHLKPKLSAYERKVQSDLAQQKSRG